jgi:hypothetical protein
MHHRAALAWCSATPIRHTRPCRDDSVLLPSCVSRPAALLGFSHPSQVCSRGRVARHLCRPGPTCRFCRAFTPIDFGRVQVQNPSPKPVRSRCFDFWASLPSAIRFRLQLPAIDPALGFASCRYADALLRMRTGSTPIASSAPGIPPPACDSEPRVPIRSWASRESTLPFSVLMGPMPWPT